MSGNTMVEFYEESPGRVHMAHLVLHLYLQTFCVPGTSSVNMRKYQLFHCYLTRHHSCRSAVRREHRLSTVLDLCCAGLADL